MADSPAWRYPSPDAGLSLSYSAAASQRIQWEEAGERTEECCCECEAVEGHADGRKEEGGKEGKAGNSHLE